MDDQQTKKSVFAFFNNLLCSDEWEKSIQKKINIGSFLYQPSTQNQEPLARLWHDFIFFTIFFDTVLPLARIARNKPQAWGRKKVKQMLVKKLFCEIKKKIKRLNFEIPTF